MGLPSRFNTSVPGALRDGAGIRATQDAALTRFDLDYRNLATYDDEPNGDALIAVQNPAGDMRSVPVSIGLLLGASAAAITASQAAEAAIEAREDAQTARDGAADERAKAAEQALAAVTEAIIGLRGGADPTLTLQEILDLIAALQEAIDNLPDNPGGSGVTLPLAVNQGGTGNAQGDVSGLLVGGQTLAAIIASLSPSGSAADVSARLAPFEASILSGDFGAFILQTAQTLAAMTGNTSPAGNTAGGTSVFTSSNNYFHAFDQKASTYWASAAAVSSARLDRKTPAPIRVGGVAITGSPTDATKSPRDFSIVATNDDFATIVTLETFTAQTEWGLSERRLFTVPVANRGTYARYGVATTATNGGANIHIAELELLQDSYTPTPGLPVALAPTPGDVVSNPRSAPPGTIVRVRSASYTHDAYKREAASNSSTIYNYAAALIATYVKIFVGQSNFAPSAALKWLSEALFPYLCFILPESVGYQRNAAQAYVSQEFAKFNNLIPAKDHDQLTTCTFGMFAVYSLAAQEIAAGGVVHDNVHFSSHYGGQESGAMRVQDGAATGNYISTHVAEIIPKFAEQLPKYKRTRNETANDVRPNMQCPSVSQRQGENYGTAVAAGQDSVYYTNHKAMTTEWPEFVRQQIVASGGIDFLPWYILYAPNSATTSGTPNPVNTDLATDLQRIDEEGFRGTLIALHDCPISANDGIHDSREARLIGPDKDALATRFMMARGVPMPTLTMAYDIVNGARVYRIRVEGNWIIAQLTDPMARPANPAQNVAALPGRPVEIDKNWIGKYAPIVASPEGITVIGTDSPVTVLQVVAGEGVAAGSSLLTRNEVGIQCSAAPTGAGRKLCNGMISDPVPLVGDYRFRWPALRGTIRRPTGVRSSLKSYMAAQGIYLDYPDEISLYLIRGRWAF